MCKGSAFPVVLSLTSFSFSVWLSAWFFFGDVCVCVFVYVYVCAPILHMYSAIEFNLGPACICVCTIQHRWGIHSWLCAQRSFLVELTVTWRFELGSAARKARTIISVLAFWPSILHSIYPDCQLPCLQTIFICVFSHKLKTKLAVKQPLWLLSIFLDGSQGTSVRWASAKACSFVWYLF